MNIKERARQERLQLAAEDPGFRTEMRLDIILEVLLLKIITNDTRVRSIDPVDLHRCIPWLLIGLVANGVDVSDLHLYRDVVTNDYPQVRELLSGLYGVLFHHELGNGQDQDYHFNDNPYRILGRLIDWDFFEKEELSSIDRAVDLAAFAFREKLNIDEVLRKANLTRD